MVYHSERQLEAERDNYQENVVLAWSVDSACKP